MTALETLLTKLASDEEREQLAPKYDGTTCSSTRVNGWNAGYTAAHARMSLLVEIIKIQNFALEQIRNGGVGITQCIDFRYDACEALERIEAMAKEQT